MAEPDSRKWAVSIPHAALVAAIRREMDDYLSHLAELEVLQKSQAPDHPDLDERRTVLIILLSVYLEAIINLYYSFAFAPGEFKEVDRKSVQTKWSTIPAK